MRYVAGKVVKKQETSKAQRQYAAQELRRLAATLEQMVTQRTSAMTTTVYTLGYANGLRDARNRAVRRARKLK